jgi:hypothetical protein
MYSTIWGLLSVGHVLPSGVSACYYAFCTLTPINPSIHFYLYLFVIVDQRSVWYKSMSCFEDFRRKKEVVFKYLVFRTPSSSQHSTTMTAVPSPRGPSFFLSGASANTPVSQ